MKRRQIRMAEKEERHKERDLKRHAKAAEKAAAEKVSENNSKPSNKTNIPNPQSQVSEPKKGEPKDDLPDINDPEVQKATMKIQDSMKRRQIRMAEKEERHKERDLRRQAKAAEQASEGKK